MEKRGFIKDEKAAIFVQFTYNTLELMTIRWIMFHAAECSMPRVIPGMSPYQKK